MTAAHKNTWKLFIAELPWLTEADRALVEIATELRTRLICDRDYGIQGLNLLRLCLGSLGASPTDRNKIAPPPEPPDASEKYFLA